ncbi:MAG: hypothetical protein RR513_00930 [Muribaculaceae bacterium]
MKKMIYAVMVLFLVLTSCEKDDVEYGGYVDLGLSVKWASCNVGASSPEGYGNYYTCKAAKLFSLPTKAQMEELYDKCTWEVITLKEVTGMKVTGPNGNSIFMPCAGYRYDSTLIHQGEFGYVWSSTLYPSNDGDAAYNLYFYNGGYQYVNFSHVNNEFSVRPVAEK